MVPEIFKPVEIPDMIQKNMYNDVAVVQKDPLIQCPSLPMAGPDFLLGQSGDDIIRDCFDLPLGCAGTDDKGIRYRSLNTRQIQNHNVLRFLVLSRGDDRLKLVFEFNVDLQS